MPDNLHSFRDKKKRLTSPNKFFIGFSILLATIAVTTDIYCYPKYDANKIQPNYQEEKTPLENHAKTLEKISYNQHY